MKRHFSSVRTRAVIIWVLFSFNSANAAETHWICASGAWQNPNCWDLLAIPRAGDDVSILNLSNQALSVRYASPLAADTLASLVLDSVGSARATLLMRDLGGSGDVLNALSEVIGSTGHGRLTQSGGTQAISSLRIGALAGSLGEYQLSGGSLQVETDAVIGAGGRATFVQSNGRFETGALTIGGNAGSIGQYHLTNGDLVTNHGTLIPLYEAQIGSQGHALFVQTGGTFTAGQITLGADLGGVGKYVMFDGLINLPAEAPIVVGDLGTGTFLQLGGTVQGTLGMALVVGQTGRGLYDLRDGTLRTTYTRVEAAGILRQRGGQHSAEVANIHGLLELSGGVFTGGSCAIQGVLRQTGGQYTGGNLTYTHIVLGGRYELHDGVLAPHIELTIEDGSTLIQNGGTHDVPNLYVGRGGANKGDETSPSMYQLSGGVLTASSTIIGSAGSVGAFFQSGGEHRFQHIETSVGSSYELAGGQLVGAQIRGNGSFTVTGGELAIDSFEGDLLGFAGVMAPGAENGLTVISGNYSQDAQGTLMLTLGGPAPGIDFDALQITGTATLHGALEVNLAAGFVPEPGDTFDVVTASAIVGQFDELRLPQVPGLVFGVNYLSGAVRVVVDAADR